MLVSFSAQKPFPFGDVAGDRVHIWDPGLKLVDELLTDENYVDILFRSLHRQAPQATKQGRRRMAVNQLLRFGVLKHIKNWSFRDLARETERNLDYRALSQVFEQKVPGFRTLARNVATIDGDALRAFNEHLCQRARELGVIQGKNYRQDTTVCDSNIHHPTDSTLLQDGIRVLTRFVKKAEELVPGVGRVRDYAKAARNRVLEIHRAAKGKGDAARDRRVQSYRELLRITRPAVTAATKAAAKLADNRVTQKLGLLEAATAAALRKEIDTMAPRVEQVIRQTRARVLRGDNQYPGKLVSLFAPLTSVIRKGKAHKPTEFGRLVDIVEIENGFVSDYRVLDGNPDDGSLLIPALERHKQRFGRAPNLAATDRGFWSAKNEKQAYALGVKRVCIPVRGKLSTLRLRIQHSRWFRKGQRWRANGEGRIGILKNVYGMDRCMYQGDDAMERWIGWCVLANNLVVVARALQKQRQRHDDQAGTTQEEDAREAA